MVKISRCNGCEDIPLPKYQTGGAAGLDLYAAVDEPVTLNPGDIKLISAGIRLTIPPGYEGQVRPRSGLALKFGIGIVNSPGTIDSDYRGVVGVILVNFGKKPFVVSRCDRVAQLIVCRVEKVSLIEVNLLDSSGRESGGFGSTGP